MRRKVGLLLFAGLGDVGNEDAPKYITKTVGRNSEYQRHFQTMF